MKHLVTIRYVFNVDGRQWLVAFDKKENGFDVTCADITQQDKVHGLEYWFNSNELPTEDDVVFYLDTTIVSIKPQL